LMIGYWLLVNCVLWLFWLFVILSCDFG